MVFKSLQALSKNTGNSFKVVKKEDPSPIVGGVAACAVRHVQEYIPKEFQKSSNNDFETK